jgi:hypothetical protein
LSPASAGNATVSQPTSLTFTPTSTFHGLVQITAVLIASNGQSQIEDVLVLMNTQSNPSRNPDVLGLVDAQAMQAERFAQDQLSNIQSRLDSLHDGNGTARFSNNLSISLDGKSLQAPTGAGASGLQVSSSGASPFLRHRWTSHRKTMHPRLQPKRHPAWVDGWMARLISARSMPIAKPGASIRTPSR